MCIGKSLALPPLQSTIFVDDTFDYSGQILEKIPFVANVDPLKKAQYRSLEELTDPIKVVIYMVAMRSSWMRSSSGSKRQIRPISAIMRMKMHLSQSSRHA